MERYWDWIERIPTIDKGRLLFMDESQVVDREVWKRMALAPRGQRAFAVRNSILDHSISISLLLNLKKNASRKTTESITKLNKMIIQEDSHPEPSVPSKNNS